MSAREAPWSLVGAEGALKGQLSRREFVVTVMGGQVGDLLSSLPRPTMYAYYFGIDGRTLESDDTSALQCAESRY